MQPLKTSGYSSRLSHAGSTLTNPEITSRPIKSKNKNARLANMLQRVSSVKSSSYFRPRDERNVSPSSSDTFAGKTRNSARDLDSLQGERLGKDFTLMSRRDLGTPPEGHHSPLKRSFDTMVAMSRHTSTISSMRRLPSWLSHACGSLSPGHPLRKFGPPTPPVPKSPDTSREEEHYRNDNSKEAWLNSTGAHQESLAILVPKFSGSRSFRSVKQPENTPNGTLSFPGSGSRPHYAQFPVPLLPSMPEDGFPYPPTCLSASRSSIPAPLSPGMIAFYSDAEQSPISRTSDQANLLVPTADTLQAHLSLIVSSPLKGDNVLPASPVIHSSVEIIHPSTRKVGKFEGFTSSTPLLSVSPVPMIPITPITHQPHSATNNIYSNQLLHDPAFESSSVQDDAVSVALRANQSFFAPTLGVAFSPSPKLFPRINPARSPLYSFQERSDSLDIRNVPLNIPASFDERSGLSAPFIYRNPNLATPSTSALKNFSRSSPSPSSINLLRHRLKKKRDMYGDRLLEYASYAAEDAPIPALILGFGLGPEANFRKSQNCGTATPEQDDKHYQCAVSLKDDPDLEVDVQPLPQDPSQPIWVLPVPKGCTHFRSGQAQDKFLYSDSLSNGTSMLQVTPIDANPTSVNDNFGADVSAERLSDQFNSMPSDEIEDDAPLKDEPLSVVALQEDHLRISSSPSSINSWSNEDMLSYLKGEKRSGSKRG